MIWEILYYVALFNTVVWAILAFVSFMFVIFVDDWMELRRIRLCFVLCLVLMFLFQSLYCIAYVNSTAPSLTLCSICKDKQRAALHASNNLTYLTETVANYINSPCPTPHCINHIVVE